MAREERQAMTRERLAEIRKRWSEREHGQLDVSGRYRNPDWAGTWNYWITNVAADEGELLAEVERLRAREAALVAVVERAARGPHWAIDLYTLQEQARALVASAEGEAAAASGGSEATE